MFHPWMSRKCFCNVLKNICFRCDFDSFIWSLWNPWALHICRSAVIDKFCMSVHSSSAYVTVFSYGTPFLHPFLMICTGWRLDSHNHCNVNNKFEYHYSCKKLLTSEKERAHCVRHSESTSRQIRIEGLSPIHQKEV